MTVEVALYPNQLNASWPTQGDIVREGAGHIRTTKTVLKTTLPNVSGAISASHIELSYSTGLSGPIQAQINAKGAIAGQKWTGPHIFNGTQTLSAATTIGAVTAAEISYLSGVTGSIQTQLGTKVNKAGDTYTGVHNLSGATSVSLPANTTIGPISAAVIGYIANLTSDAQAQINSKAGLSGPNTWTGTQDFTGAAITVPTQVTGTANTTAASTAFVAATALSSALPGQTGNAGKFVTTNGTNASWGWPVPSPVAISANTAAVPGNYYEFTASCTLTLPASPNPGDWLGFAATRGNAVGRVDFNGRPCKGRTPSSGYIDLTSQNDAAVIFYANNTDGWMQL